MSSKQLPLASDYLSFSSGVKRNLSQLDILLFQGTKVNGRHPVVEQCPFFLFLGKSTNPKRTPILFFPWKSTGPFE